MSAGLIFDVALCGLLGAVALWSVAGRAPFASVISFIVLSLLLAIGWVRLGAPDVAMAEVAIGAGLTGLLLLGALGRTMQQPSLRARNSWGATLLVAGGCSAVGVGLSWIVVGLIGTPGAGLREAVQAQMAGAGVENPVTAVLLNFRGYDTLLETLVLLAALLAVWTLTADEAWGRRVGVMQRVSRHGVLSVLGRLLPPFGVMIGVYVVWAGARTAGGAFQGGTILAAVWLLIMLSDAAPRPRASSPVLRAAILLGPVVFLAVGAAGLGRAGAYLGYPPAAAKPLLLVIEAALAPSIAVILALIVAGPPVRP